MRKKKILLPPGEYKAKVVSVLQKGDQVDITLETETGEILHYRDRRRGVHVTGKKATYDHPIRHNGRTVRSALSKLRVAFPTCRSFIETVDTVNVDPAGKPIYSREWRIGVVKGHGGEYLKYKHQVYNLHEAVRELCSERSEEIFPGKKKAE